MRSILFFTRIISIIFLTAGIGKSNEWCDMQMGKLNDIDSLSEVKKFETLGQMVLIGNKENLQEEETDILKRAQMMLTSIPGHAKYFQNKLRQMAENDEAAAKQEPLPYPYISSSDLAKRQAFGSLAQLPSLETVEVLGGSAF